uniref:Uncharacterized protein n=1 Tax=Arundo donax TaxID=35708 RepID=A0A0A8XSD0_ARUDO
MQDANITKSYSLPNKVKINLNMLGSLVLNRIGRHVDDADVVAVDKSSPRSVKLM